MIWQWTGKSLVAMRAVQEGLLVGWICHSFSPKNWTSQVKHCTMTSNFWFWETVPAWYVKMSKKHITTFIFVFFEFLSPFHLCTLRSTKNGWSAKYNPCNKLMAILQGKKTAYWMYFGLYIRWKFRKHYGISLFLFLLWSSATRKPVNKLLFDHSWELEFSHQNSLAGFIDF